MNFPSDNLPLPDQFTHESAKLFKRNTERTAGQADPTTLPAAVGRAQSASNDLFYNSTTIPVASVRDDVIAGVCVRRYRHSDAGPGVVLYVHGGGWAFGSVDTHDVITRALARSAKVEVISVGYRCAPESLFPAALDDCLAVYTDLVASVMPSSEIVLMGDSAGAHLCLLMMLRMQEKKIPTPAGACLIYGVYDDDISTPSHIRFGPSGFGLTSTRMQNYWEWFIPATLRDAAYVRPLRDASDESLAVLPPLFLSSAGLDCLKSDTRRLVDRLQTAGHTAHSHEEVLGVMHGHLLAVHHLKATRDLINTCGAKIRNFLA
jgi:acetyl esterase